MIKHASGGCVLSEDEVRLISRSVRSFVPSDVISDDTSLEGQLKEFRTLLQDVLVTCASSTLKHSHRVAAWNTLCSLTDLAVESPLPEVRTFVWADHVWEQSFELYLTHAHHARPKSSRQLQVTLTNALRKAHDDHKARMQYYCTVKLLDCLIDFEEPRAAKASMQLIGHLLSRDVLALTDLLDVFNRVQASPVSTLSSAVIDLVHVLFRWLSKGDFASSVAQLLTILLDKADHEGISNGQPFWIEPLQRSLVGSEIDASTLRVHVLPVLFRRKCNDFIRCLQILGIENIGDEVDTTSVVFQQTGLLYIALQTGKELGLVEETESLEFSYTSTIVFMPVHIIGRLLFQQPRSARIAGLSLLIASHSATKPIPTAALRLIRRALSIMIADADADFRSEVFGAVQRLVDRIRAITAVLARQIRGSNETHSQKLGKEVSSIEKCFAEHRDLIHWLRRFLLWELRPTASYQRHISSLKCLMTLIKSGLDEAVPTNELSKPALGNTKWPFHLHVMDKMLQRLLLDLVVDPFDDVRQAASAILGIYMSQESLSAQSLERSSIALSLERAEGAMLRSGRADQADGVAHLYALSSNRNEMTETEHRSPRDCIIENLLEKLRRTIRIAQAELSEAVAKYPVHGLLTSIRYTLNREYLSERQDIHVLLFENLKQIWHVVKPVLCNDAPEGYMPEELEEPIGTTKEMLSYCWRALKETSLLLNALVTSAHLSEDMLYRMCDLCFAQLAELRHRGAFSTVAQTWISCCTKYRDMRSPTHIGTLEHWYARLLTLLRNNQTINTRRSAGLPSLLCGILIADKSDYLLEKAFQDLELIARMSVDVDTAEVGSLSQVHAMNCLKDVLKSSRLGEQSERFVPSALQLAADALQSDVWAIRNCGLMLFRAVIDRLLGTDQPVLEDEIIIRKHISLEGNPELLDIVLKLLRLGKSLSDQVGTRYEGVFPALQLLRHIRVPENRFDDVLEALTILLRCSSWHVRDKAAQTVTALLVAKQQLIRIEGSLNAVDLETFTSHNALHGSLLVTKYIFVALRKEFEEHGGLLEASFGIGSLSLIHKFLGRSLDGLFDGTVCFVTVAALVDCIREAFDTLTTGGKRNDLIEVHGRFVALLKRTVHINNPDMTGHMGAYWNLILFCLQGPGAETLRQAVARLIAQQIVLEDYSKDEDIQAAVALLISLAQHDEDACKHFISVLDKQSVSKGNIKLFSSLANEILQSDFGMELKCEAQHMLIELLSTDHDISYMTLPIARWFRTFHASENWNQRFVDQTLELRGLYLERVIARSASINEPAPQIISSWVDDCVTAITGTGVHTLEASVHALGQVGALWSILKSRIELDSVFLKLCVAVYDVLNDDDEDFRLAAASVTGKILATDSISPFNTFETIAASQRLLDFIVKNWDESDALIRIALERTVGAFADRSTPVADQLDNLANRDTALFAEEKQNLYLDEAREARAWSQVLQRCSTRIISQPLAKELALWVIDGLDSLIRKSQTKDGPLGWSSDADVFTLGLRVMYGAEVMLSWAKRCARIPLRPSSLREKLLECEKALQASEANELWIWEISRILADAVMDKIAAVRVLLANLPIQIC